MNTFFRNAARALAISLMLPLFAAAELPQQTQARKEALQLTRSIEQTSRKIQRDADDLGMGHRSQFSNRSHNIKLQRIKAHINEQLKPAFDRLAALQPQLPEWKQGAVDQMRTSAVSLAASTNEAILKLNNNQIGRPAALNPEYGELVASMASHADSLVQLADATSDYSGAQLKGHEAGLPIASHN